MITLDMRGRRECRVLAAPMARLQQKKQAAVTTGTPNIPAFPARWCYGLFRALLGEPGFVATVIGGLASADLTPASGCQDHTASPSALTPLVLRHPHVHRILLPTFVTTRTPLFLEQDAGIMHDFRFS